MRFLIYTILIASWMGLFQSCEEASFLRKEWDVESENKFKPVISGFINAQDSSLIARVDFTQPINTTQSTLPQPADVRIQLGNDNQGFIEYKLQESFSENWPATFEVLPAGFLRPGERYDMIVDIEGVGTYRASTTIPDPDQIPTMLVTNLVEDFEYGPYYMVTVRQSDASSMALAEYILSETRDFYYMRILVPDFDENDRWDFRYNAFEGDEYLHTVAILEPGYYNYLLTLNQKLLQNEDPFAYFSKTPTNFDNGAIGYLGSIAYRPIE